MAREPDGRLTTLLSEEERVTVMLELVFAGRPAESRVSTRTVPWLVGLASCVPGTGMTFSVVANPLGVLVVTGAEAALSPLEEAEIEVTPGVALVVKLAMVKAEPCSITTWLVTVPTLSWEEVRKTTVSSRATEGALVKLCRETTMAR